MTKPFRVTLVVTTEHEYEIDANTPEEAESVAEQWFEEGEEGTTTISTVEQSEAIPSEDE